ncbi:Pentatricopeptide repeat-containing protein [Forsythia ovata]|uniref:Pentatricopeptide repeat-containing protein n=1 Tax=Forsythia ovata TaxID=205694 RepID=A0ABD1WVS6_9LAMI
MIVRQVKLKTFSRIPLQKRRDSKFFCSFYHGRHVLDENPKPSFVSSHRCMLNSIHQGRQFEALNIFKKQLQMGISQIDEVAIAIALKACRGDPKLGSQIHGFAIISGYTFYVTVSNSLMNMYCKSQYLDKALSIFKNLKNPDTISYNTILSGYENGEDALKFAYGMRSSGVVFDAVSYTCVLAHCADFQAFDFGIQFHCLVLKFGLESEIFIGNALVTMYSKWGKIVEAERVFSEMSDRDLVSWNAILSGYAQEGTYGLEAILAFVEMVREGMKLDHVSFTSVVSACGYERNLVFGRQIHMLSVKRGYDTHVSVCNVLISMYSKCDVVEDAKLVFENMIDRNVVSWTTMLSIIEEDAVSLFMEMRRDGIYPNDVTFVGLIHAITTNNMMQEGLLVHGFCIKTNFISELNVANSFITMYGKFELMEDSIKVFEELNSIEIISWNALISGYSMNGMYQEAVQKFLSASMELLPNHYTFGSVLNAIASSESISLRQGQRFHGYILKLGLNTDPVVSGALLDMYAKRGSIYESQKIFHGLVEKSQVAWTAIISAHARHGDYESVMKWYEEMVKSGVKPDSITFLSILTACGRKGMVDMGIEIFNAMVNDHSIEPYPEHYSCMIDMLGRAGRLEAAEEFINRIPGGPGLSMLQSLLGACKIYRNEEMAMRVADVLIAKEPEDSGSYVLMSNLFAEKGKWENVAKMRKMMRDRKVKKEVGFSWADVGNVVDSIYLHGFSSGDKSHPLSKEIFRMSELLGSEMKYLEKQEEKDHLVFDPKRLKSLESFTINGQVISIHR